MREECKQRVGRRRCGVRRHTAPWCLQRSCGGEDQVVAEARTHYIHVARGRARQRNVPCAARRTPDAPRQTPERIGRAQSARRCCACSRVCACVASDAHGARVGCSHGGVRARSALQACCRPGDRRVCACHARRARPGACGRRVLTGITLPTGGRRCGRVTARTATGARSSISMRALVRAGDARSARSGRAIRPVGAPRAHAACTATRRNGAVWTRGAVRGPAEL